MTRMTNRQEARRAGVENGLLRLRRHRMDIDLGQLRLNQAMSRRPELRELLEPVLIDLEQIKKDYDALSLYLSSEWQAGQAAGWEGEP